ncbi:MAG: hypothetical protein A2583_08645 [Bdellovibrionales bacterium RIFOXYD1_FULL_53_11]|nr:MAG: hypothetical protein A2583_08645 [Bdellovibrionales bacterium RIFOXYD1_FULL_53_11]
MRTAYLFAAAVMIAGCGEDKIDGTMPPVTIPSVVVQCSGAAYESCENKRAAVFWATSECTVSNINARHYTASAATVVSTSDCSGGGCLLSVSSWNPPHSSETTTTQIPPGNYNLCVFIDSSGDGTVGNSGDWMGTINVVVDKYTAEQTVPNYRQL